MDNHRKIKERTKHASRIPTRFMRVFTLKKCVLLFILGTVLLAHTLLKGWHAFQHIRTTEAQLRQIIGQQDSITYHDELLTLSAKMAAATGDLKWANRYEELGPRPKPTVEDSWNISENDTVGADVILTAFANDKLVAMEKRVFVLVSQADYDSATMLLRSPEYEDQKQAYNRGMKAFLGGVRKNLENRYNENWKRIQWAGIIIGIILPVIALIWFVGYKVGRRLYVRAQTKQQKSALTHEWQETFNAITDGVCIIDKKRGKILQCNKAMTQFLGKPHDEIIGQSCCELLHGSSKPVKKCPLVRMYENRRSETTDYQVGDRWLNIKVDPYFDHQGNLTGAVHILSDITEPRKADRALKESEKRFRLAFANAQDAIIWIDGESGTVTNCNKATEEIFQRRRKEIIGQHYTTFYPEDKARRYHSLLGEPGKRPKNSFEAEVMTKNGVIRIVTIAVSTMIVDGKEIVQGIMRDITESKRAIEEIKNLAKFPSEDPNPVLRISKDCTILYANDASAPALETWKIQEGQSLPEPWSRRIDEVYQSGQGATFELGCEDGHMFFMTLQPIVGSGYVNVYGLDVTKRKKAEKEKMDLELQLSQKQKMEAVGTLAGGIAHDFNNILAAMQGYLELSLDDLSEDSPVRYNLEQVLSCSNRATKLVQQILTFSRKNQEEREKEPVQISSIVKEVLGMLRSSLPTTIKICRRIHADTSVVLADPTQIHQILVNLCTNASHAMRQTGGLLEVSLIDVDFESETRIGDEYLNRGSYVKLSVSDSGCGMEKEVLERIFEPFFTTKKVNEGTGLGLSVVHGIIKSHEGAIAVSSVPGEGTTFDIFLPKIEDPSVDEPQPSEPVCKEKEVILLVDDEEMMVDVTRKILERLGFAVVAKTGSLDALETFQERPDEFDLVLTDQVMPNMTGTQLAQKLISIRPDIPVILCSGFPESVCLDEVESIGIKKFLMKPIGREEIANVVRAVLDKSQMPV